MARRLTRKQIKHDEFVTVVDHGMHWLSQNWQRVAIVAGSALAAGLVIWGAIALLGSRSSSATAALSEALASFNAPVGAAAPADAKVKFATDSERLAAAEKGFQRVSSKYWLTEQARTAKLYLAAIANERGDAAQAVRLLGELTAKHRGDPITRWAMSDLVRLRIAKGEGAQLQKDLEAMAAGTDPRLTRDAAMFQLAVIQERAGKQDEAAKLFKKLVDDYPESSFAYEARQRLAASS